MKIHFISGLPRSGSTLLAGILRQNPCIHASIQSPIGQSLVALHTSMSGANESHGFITDGMRMRILRGLFAAYYDDAFDVVFDSNRRWCAKISLILELFPDAYVIACVRDPVAIIDSIERLLQKHPARLSTIIGLDGNTTVYDRAKMLAASGGLFGYAWNATKEAYYGMHNDRLIMVNYEDLAQFPERVFTELHEKLSLPTYNYDFSQIEQIPGADAFDASIGTPGLHMLKNSVSYESRTSILPPDIYNNLPRPFWTVKELQTDA